MKSDQISSFIQIFCHKHPIRQSNEFIKFRFLGSVAQLRNQASRGKKTPTGAYEVKKWYRAQGAVPRLQKACLQPQKDISGFSYNFHGPQIASKRYHPKAQTRPPVSHAQGYLWVFQHGFPRVLLCATETIHLSWWMTGRLTIVLVQLGSARKICQGFYFFKVFLNCLLIHSQVFPSTKTLHVCTCSYTFYYLILPPAFHKLFALV